MVTIFFRLQMKFLKFQNLYFLHVQLQKTSLIKYFFSEHWLSENKNILRRKPDVNSYHVLEV